MKPFKVVRDRLLVRQDGVEEKTVGSIIVPVQAQERPHTGLVESVGPDVKSVAAGDRIHWLRFSGASFQMGENTFLVLREEDIVVVEPAE